jgi:hypothetical protein
MAPRDTADVQRLAPRRPCASPSCGYYARAKAELCAVHQRIATGDHVSLWERSVRKTSGDWVQRELWEVGT